MEIHVPKAPHTWREFVRELVTITAGILIALSLEGLTEWNHHRHLVREARENIVSEVRANLQELKHSQASFQETFEQLHRFENVLHAIEQHQKPDTDHMRISYDFAELHRTSWNTATNTGAIGYTPYEEVKRIRSAGTI